MENKVIEGILLTAAVTFTLVSCSEKSGFVCSGESVDLRFNESSDWNNTHQQRTLVSASDSYSVTIVADSHLGNTVNLEKILSIDSKNCPLALVMAGDLTGGKSDEYDRLEKHLPGNDSTALFMVVGNHDLWYNGWDEYFSRFGSSTYYFTVQTPSGSDLFICLDSGSGTLGAEQTKWLNTLLEKHREEYRRCIIITHVNFFRIRHTGSATPLTEEVGFLLDLFTRYRVDMVITGHDHLRDISTLGVTTYLQVDALEDGLPNAGYLELNISDGLIDFHLRRFSE